MSIGDHKLRLMKQTLILIVIAILISCQSNKTNKMDESNQNDSVSNQDSTYHALSDTENLSLWNTIDKINNELSKLDKYPSIDVLERLFKESVTISNSNELSDEFNNLRSEAYDSDNFSIIDQYVNRCKPAITVAIMGESNNMGVNIDYFITICRPKTAEYNFFELAKDGFYTSSNLSVGTAEFPEWIEQTESSFQGIVVTEKAKTYLQKWQSIQKNQKGFLRDIADTTIYCLQIEINNNLENKKESSIPAEAVIGDFDGDSITEYVWLVPPKFPKEQNEDNFGDCDGLCECYLMFSNDKIPPIKLENCIGGTPVNEGDLNNDGADEVGILPQWWTSCWRNYQVYTLRNNKWKYVVAPFPTHCNQWEEGVDAIKKDNSKQGYVIIHYSLFTDEDIVVLSKSVQVER